MTEPVSPQKNRREFLKVLGAGTAAVATVGCGTDHVQKLIPYVHHPDETVPGVSTYYATTCRECAAACGVVAETRDGRVIKLEGNPEHPLSRGALCARGQAAVQGLYNPDRFRTPMIRKGGKLVAAKWQEAMQLFTQKVGEAKSRGQGGNVVFVNQHESGSFPGFLDGWLAANGFPAHVSYDAEAQSAVMEANRQSYGVAWPTYRFSAASLIVSFGADFLDGWGASVPQQLDFADARAKLDGAPRFVYVGPRRSLTGLNADEWVPCKPGTELVVAQALSGAMSPAAAAQQCDVPAEQLTRLAREVASAKPGLFLAGGNGANALELAQTVNRMNAGSVGTTVIPAEPIAGFEGMGGFGELYDVVQRLGAGSVSLLMVRGANPAFTMPGFAAAMAKATNTFKVSFSSYPDETAMQADLVLPDNHALESWGDAQATRGTISLQQPAMDPVFDTRATADVLIQAAQGDQNLAARYTQKDYRTWLFGRIPGGMAAITAALPSGVMAGTLPNAPAARRAPTRLNAPAGSGDLFLLTYFSPTLGDGRGANKPWLQELPDPVSKICWQSWVEVHPSTAKKLGVTNGDVVEVKTAAGTVRAPVYLFLGVRPDTIAMPLGQGHTEYGRYAKGTGVNAGAIVPSGTDAAGGRVGATMASLSRTGEVMDLVSTEGSARQHGRGIAQAIVAGANGTAVAATGAEHANEVAPTGNGGGDRERGVEQHTEHGGEESFPGDASHAFLPGLRSPVANDAQGDLGSQTSKDKGMYDPNHWSGMAKRRWAMTIDLARCTGCSACVTACYAENNIPTVGAPHQGRALAPGFPDSHWDTRPGANIVKGREMSWMRIERYFEGGEGTDTHFDATFETRFAPMLCQHCGNAPCEPVCPVYATYHSPDGLNVQVYNRCVGTRYCSNGCPYKVRYFNWFGFGEPARRQYAFPEPLNWQLNPDVTVRGKGVMEKCTFCVQRIREAENRARLEGREVRADEFTTACAQACPSRAITFGDAADPTWTVAKLAQNARGYHVFEELNTFTAVVYLKKVNHPGPGQPVYAGSGEEDR
ncbi:MAG: 4Fe-4S dicluster domain-containing protein [Gemmatimonadaceae bacterium]|nr:4Fe-4S dicluster domain-containing protein [Gemmatimonadaceae bacterium]NUR18031.1 4Fe-4S dicluster domain-containing protein [Gemmatimonadaceae bacterium]